MPENDKNDDIDNELQDMLDEIIEEEEPKAVERDIDDEEAVEEVEEAVDDLDVESEIANFEAPVVEEPKLSTEPAEDEEDDPVLHPTQDVISVTKGDLSPADNTGTATEKGPSSDQDGELIKIFKEVRQEIWNGIKEDREQIDEQITIFLERIQDPDKVKNCYVESITSLLSTKASTSTNGTRILDSMTKLIVATKNAGDGGGNTGTDLAGLLADSDDDDSGEAYDPENP